MWMDKMENYFKPTFIPWIFTTQINMKTIQIRWIIRIMKKNSESDYSKNDKKKFKLWAIDGIPLNVSFKCLITNPTKRRKKKNKHHISRMSCIQNAWTACL